jgi:hypothetical protein
LTRDCSFARAFLVWDIAYQDVYSAGSRMAVGPVSG